MHRRQDSTTPDAKSRANGSGPGHVSSLVPGRGDDAAPVWDGAPEGSGPADTSTPDQPGLSGDADPEITRAEVLPPVPEPTSTSPEEVEPIVDEAARVGAAGSERQPSGAPVSLAGPPSGAWRAEHDPATSIAHEPATTLFSALEPVSLVKAPPTTEPDAPPGAPAPAAPSEPPAEPAVQVNSTLRVVSQMLTIFAVLTLGFLIQLTLVGGLQHDRDQAQSFRELRIQLAIGTAPVGALGEDGKPLPSGTPVAILEIPRLDLEEVILEGSSSRVLMSGAGHRRDSTLPGQAGTSVVLGRRGGYGGPFGGIDGLRQGDEIIVTTGQGRHTFAVLGARRAGDPLPPALASGQGRLNLVTSDGPTFRPTDALRVDANLTSPAQPGGVQIPSRALPANEAVMAGDSSALLPLMLWAPLLLAAAVGTVWVRYRAGRWQAWVIGLPVLVLLGVTVIDTAAALLPNVL